MNLSECLTLLALIMALSAYIGSVRARMLDRAKQYPDEKSDYIRAAAGLMFSCKADVASRGRIEAQPAIGFAR